MKNTNTNTNTPTPTASLGAPQANTVPVVKHQVELDEVDLLMCAPQRYFASQQEEYAYYATKEMQDAFCTASYSDFNVPPPVDIPVLVNTAPAQAPIPVVSNTQPRPVPAASTANPIVTLAWCNAWLQFTYAHELAELVALGVYVQARAVRAPGEVFGPSASVLLTVKDGLVGGEVGLDGELTFTFWDTDHPKVELAGLNMAQFQDMARRFWQALPIIKDVYQARASYMAATGANPAETMPDVEDRADPMPYHWFTGAALPKMDETQNQYPQPKLLALVETYDQWAVDGV